MAAGPLIQMRCADTYLRSALGSDLIVIGTYFGHGEGFTPADAPPPPGAHDTEDLPALLSVPLFIMNLHQLPASGPVQECFQRVHATRAGISWEDPGVDDAMALLFAMRSASDKNHLRN